MKPRWIRALPGEVQFGPIGPEGLPEPMGEPIYMAYDEFEAFRLIYHDGLNQEDAASQMRVSRGTVWRCLESARNKVSAMLVERRPLVITPKPPESTEEPST